MKRYLRIGALVAVLALVAAACGTDTSSPGTSGGTETSGAIPTGGTLQAAMTADFFYGLDPTAEYYSVSWEFLRCCMARTMLSYTGKPAEEGGGEPLPDLATDMPTQSDDGLVWTFTIKDGVMFGDPLNREIVAEDFVNAINRLSDPKNNTHGYPFYYTAIKGFSEAEGDQVEGVKALDDKTLEVTLDVPEPDMPFLFSMAATAPIPTELIEAHYEEVKLGQFLVSSGPYQYEGMEGLDLTGDTPPSGMKIGKSYVFVRNPMWDKATDDLRFGYVDKIEVNVGGEVQDLLDKVEQGVIDWCIDCGATATSLQKYTTDPDLQDNIHTHPSDALAYHGINVFQPPFDDVHVRKAVNWAIDKDALWRLVGGPPSGDIANHFIPPGMMGGLNADYNPYPSPNNQGDPAQAAEEMKLSAYDSDGDGVCDDPSCNTQILTVTGDNDAIKSAEIFADSIESLGIILEIKAIQYNALVAKCSQLLGHTTLCAAGWGKDYPSPYTFFYPLLDQGENGSNYAFIGTTGEALAAEGYSGYEVDDAGLAIPNITADIVACRLVPIGPEQSQCWADLDKKVMEEIVPVIPRRFPNDIDIWSDNVVHYSYDQFAGIGAVDQFAVAG